MKTTPNAIRQAAIVVASLDTDTADSLLAQMPAEQAAIVRRMVMELGDIDPREQNEVLVEFCRVGPGPGKQLEGIELEGSLAQRFAHPPVLPPRAKESTAKSDGPYLFLHDAECEQLIPLLATERPQTIALVVAHLPPDRAVKILSHLPAVLQAEVVRRWVDMEEADPEILREVESALQSRISLYIRDQRRRVVGVDTVAKILAASHPEVRTRILSNLEDYDAPLAARLVPHRQPEFNDLEALDDDRLAAILQAADPQVAVLALTGARRALVDRVLKNLPAREAKLLRRSLERLGPTPLSDVEQAQQDLLGIAQRIDRQHLLKGSKQHGFARTS